MGPVIAGVFSALFVLAVLVLLCHCYRQSHKLGKPSALPFKLRHQFRWDRVLCLALVERLVVMGLILG